MKIIYKRRLNWFLITFSLLCVIGLVTLFAVGKELTSKALTFILPIAFIGALGCSLTGPKFERLVRESNRMRKNR